MISVVVPHWPHSPEIEAKLRRCVASLRAAVGEVIVVVNEPPAPDRTDLARHINRGLALASGDWIVVAGNDTWLVRGQLEALCRPDTITSPAVNDAVQPFWGCFFCVPAAIFTRHGGFDEAFTGYCEDADYAVRMSNAGIPLVGVPEVQVAHEAGSSMRLLDTGRLQAVNEARFVARHGRMIEMYELAGPPR